MKRYKYILGFIALVGLTACTDDILPDLPGGENEKGIGEMVLFTSGTTNTNVATRADGDGGDDGGDDGNDDGGSKNDGITITPGKTYYMPAGGRFVCRMYYKASASGSGGQNDPYDVSGNTDITAWLKVSGNVGNSLYWNKEYDDSKVDTSIKGIGGIDDFGNDYSATAFYWQNRREHAFLAWTDLNRLSNIPYSPDKNSGGLKFEPADEIYQKHTGLKQTQWVNEGYEVYPGQIFKTWAELRTFMETGSNYESLIKNQKPAEADITDQYYYYAYGWSCKFCYEKDYLAHYEEVDATHQKTGWKEYQMFYDKLPYEGETSGQNIIVRNDAKGVPAYLFDNAALKYLAQIDIKFYKLDSEGKPTETIYTPEATDINTTTGQVLDLTTVKDGDRIKKADDENPIAQCVFVYNLTDNYGNEKYDETKPRYTFYFRDLEANKEQEVIEEYQANTFDLTRKPVLDAEGNISSYGINRIGEQPDIIQALTEQAPLGATQEANRVNLYFKHQFSQVQVNIKTSADLSVEIEKGNIQKVELLGVTEKGYVFTELNDKGKVEPTTYAQVDVSKYSDEHLAHNQYGTAFEMFDMAEGNPDYEYPAGYLTAYNAITFGQLQAIRITWNEAADGSGIDHESTYHVANEKLKNLESGKKYVWNIELRRGTLAIVRTEIVDWIVPANELEYSTNGTISN